MSVEIKVPILPESVSEATVATWHKQVGDAVSVDENIVDIETEKVVLEVPSTVDGVIKEIKVEEGATVGEQDLIAIIEEGAAASAPTKPAAAEKPQASSAPQVEAADNSDDADKLSPAVRKIVAENNLDASTIKGTGKNGRILKDDVLKHLKSSAATNDSTAKSGSVSADKKNTSGWRTLGAS